MSHNAPVADIHWTRKTCQAPHRKTRSDAFEAGLANTQLRASAEANMIAATAA